MWLSVSVEVGNAYQYKYAGGRQGENAPVLSFPVGQVDLGEHFR